MSSRPPRSGPFHGAVATDPRHSSDCHAAVTKSDARLRGIAPVVRWAGLGLVVLGLEAYVFSHWIISGDAKPTPAGPTPIPDWMVIVGHGWEIGGLVPFGLLVYYFLIRQWRRAGRITTDGMFVIIFTLLYWQDPFLNYFQNWATYNTKTFSFNLGNWAASVPGWQSPRGSYLAEPLLWVGPVYLYIFFGAAVIGTWIMRKARACWPRIGFAGLLLVCYVSFLLFDRLVEIPFTRLGFYTFAGAAHGLTIFSGHFYQFPIFEPIVVAAMWTGFAALRYFGQEHGLTFVERGINELTFSGARRTVIRFLALFAGVNTIMALVYSIPVMLYGLAAAGPWPQEILERSYFVDDMCGAGTPYTCPR
jgi:hypothetical protein